MEGLNGPGSESSRAAGVSGGALASSAVNLNFGDDQWALVAPRRSLARHRAGLSRGLHANSGGCTINLHTCPRANVPPAKGTETENPGGYPSRESGWLAGVRANPGWFARRPLVAARSRPAVPPRP